MLAAITRPLYQLHCPDRLLNKPRTPSFQDLIVIYGHSFPPPPLPPLIPGHLELSAQGIVCRWRAGNSPVSSLTLFDDYATRRVFGNP